MLKHSYKLRQVSIHFQTHSFGINTWNLLDADEKSAEWDLQLHNEDEFLIEYED